MIKDHACLILTAFTMRFFVSLALALPVEPFSGHWLEHRPETSKFGVPIGVQLWVPIWLWVTKFPSQFQKPWVGEHRLWEQLAIAGVQGFDSQPYMYTSASHTSVSLRNHGTPTRHRWFYGLTIDPKKAGLSTDSSWIAGSAQSALKLVTSDGIPQCTYPIQAFSIDPWGNNQFSGMAMEDLRVVAACFCTGGSSHIVVPNPHHNS